MFCITILILLHLFFYFYFLFYFIFFLLILFFQSGTQQYLISCSFFTPPHSSYLSFLSLLFLRLLPTPVSRSNVLLAMSLNGLDNPTVLEAYQTALTEAGGW